MNPFKEKAKELVDRFKDENYFLKEDMLDNAKHNAIIAVKEILKIGVLSKQSALYRDHKIKPSIKQEEYWKQVIKEIKLL